MRLIREEKAFIREAVLLMLPIPATHPYADHQQECQPENRTRSTLNETTNSEHRTSLTAYIMQHNGLCESNKLRRSLSPEDAHCVET